MTNLKRLGYPLPVHPKIYDFGRFHGYVEPAVDVTFAQLVSRVMLDRSLDRKEAELIVLKVLREDFDRWFWRRFR